MLEPLPSRNVARFMLPLADVMTVLFSLFLLMPHLERAPGEGGSQSVTPGGSLTPEEQRRLIEERDHYRRMAQAPVSVNYKTVDLYILDSTGDLAIKPTGSPVLNEENVNQWLQEEKEKAGAEGRTLRLELKKPPRRPDGGLSARPTEGDLNKYKRWFALNSRGAVQYRVEGD